MTKVYTTKSNAQRAANKFDVAQVVAVEGGFIVQLPEDAAADEVPAKDIAQDAPVEDFDDGSVTGAPAYEDEQAALDAEPSQVVEAPVTLPEGAADVMMEVRVFVPADAATELARFLANKAGRGVEIINPVTGNRVSLVEAGAKPARVKTAAASGGQRGPRAKGDATVKPVVTAVSNLRMQALFDKIEAARGDLANLVALNKFARSGTYYKQAGRYIDALIEEARASEAAPVGEEVGRIAA